jgi:hypothetical protein
MSTSLPQTAPRHDERLENFICPPALAEHLRNAYRAQYEQPVPTLLMDWRFASQAD